MMHYRYLIVGGGMSADAAVRGIRETDKESTIGLVSADPEAPYNRPPLSKGLWKGKPLEKVWRGTAAFNVDMHLGCRVVGLDPVAHTVTDEQGQRYGYDRLLLATGGKPRRLNTGSKQDIIYFRTVESYRRLRSLADRGQEFVVIGAGFIGSELAAALTMVGKHVTMVFPEGLIGERVFPHDLAAYITDYYRQKGVRLLSGRTVADVRQQGEQWALGLNGPEAGPELVVDGVVAGLGIEPNIELAVAAGLEVDRGIVVDESLRTSQPDIYAAGDVAVFYNPALGRRMRVEHEDNANTMGQMAGRAMAGQAVRYDHLPFFYSDLFELGYEAVGLTDSRLETVADWQDPYHKGVIYYLADGRVRGVVLWNVWEQIDNARQLIAEPGPFTAENLRGRLPR